MSFQPYQDNPNIAPPINYQKALASIIAGSLVEGSHDGINPAARVHSSWVVGNGFVAALGLLATNNDASFISITPNNEIKPFIHGYCVGSGGLSFTNIAHSRRRTATMTLSVLSVYQAMIGSDLLNADHLSAAARYKIALEVSRRERLQTEFPLSSQSQYGGMSHLLSHEGLIWDDPEIVRVNSATQVIISRGELNLRFDIPS